MNRHDLKLTLLEIAYHRNGVCGVPFHVARVKDEDQPGEMLIIQFDTDQDVFTAAINIKKLVGDEDKGIVPTVQFIENSYRGDRYAPFMKEAVDKYKDESTRTYYGSTGIYCTRDNTFMIPCNQKPLFDSIHDELRDKGVQFMVCVDQDHYRVWQEAAQKSKDKDKDFYLAVTEVLPPALRQ